MITLNYRSLTKIKEEAIYGFGPWIVRDKFEKEGTWRIVVDAWLNHFNQMIIDVVKKRSVVVQAGSWQGVYPFLLSNMFEKVYTFEPDPVNFYCTVNNCQRDNIFKFQAVLADNPGVVFFEETTSTGQGRVEKTNSFNLQIEKKVPVQAITIDSLNLENCDFLMLDVENYEYEVLVGAANTIKKFLPVILVEHNYKDEDNRKVKDFLSNFGYKLDRMISMDYLYLHDSHFS